MKWSLKLGRILGIDVHVHFTFLLLPIGGRVLRSLLAMQLDYARATRIAARIGQGMALVFGFIGPLTNPKYCSRPDAI
jgi:Zn-dependent protease